MAVSGTLYSVSKVNSYTDNDGNTYYDTDAESTNRNTAVYNVFLEVAKKYPQGDINFLVVELDIQYAKDVTTAPVALGDVIVKVDGGGTFLKKSPQSNANWAAWFKTLLDFKGAKGSDPSEVSAGGGFGLNPDGYAFDRKCNPIDDFLKWLKLDQKLKRGIYGVGAAFFAYNTLRSPNTLIMSVNGGIAGGFLYLFLGKEDCPFDIPTLQSNAKTIAIGGAAGLALLLGYQFYLKPTMQERRIKRIVRAARGEDKPKSTTARRATTARKKPKSVTVTKRF